MSALNDIKDPITSTINFPVPLAEIIHVEHRDDFTHALYSRYFKLGGVHWRWAIVLYDDDGQSYIAIWLRCYCEAKPIFMINLIRTVTVLTAEREPKMQDQEIIKIENELLDDEAFEQEPIALADLMTPEMGFVDGANGLLNLEMKIEINQGMTCIRPAPKFTRDVDYHDICIVHDNGGQQTRFYVASNILILRCSLWKDLLKHQLRNQGKAFRVKYGSKEAFCEFLKLCYQYQDDLCARFIGPILRLSKRWGATQNRILIEKFLLRSKQIHVTEKIAIAYKYQLDKVWAYYVPHIWGTNKYLSFIKRPDIQSLPDYIVREIRDQSSIIPLAMIYEYPVMVMPIDTLEMTSEKVEINFSKWEFKAKFARRETGSGYWITVKSTFSRSHYEVIKYLMTIRIMTGNREAGTIIHGVQEDCGPSKPVWVNLPEPYGAEVHFQASIRTRDWKREYTEVEDEDFSRKKSPLDNAVLRIGGRKFYVNKELLAESSPVFAHVFKGTYNEERTKTYKLSTVIDTDYVYSALNHLYHAEKNFDIPNCFVALITFHKNFGCPRIAEAIDLLMMERVSSRAALGSIYNETFCPNTTLSSMKAVYGMDGLERVAGEEFDVSMDYHLEDRPPGPNGEHLGAQFVLNPIRMLMVPTFMHANLGVGGVRDDLHDAELAVRRFHEWLQIRDAINQLFLRRQQQQQQQQQQL